MEIQILAFKNNGNDIKTLTESKKQTTEKDFANEKKFHNQTKNSYMFLLETQILDLEGLIKKRKTQTNDILLSKKLWFQLSQFSAKF